MTKKNKCKIDIWEGCYPSNWGGKIVPEAMVHPAKYSSRLIRRIYDHMKVEGWVEAGDFVVDPFGGVALGALDAMRLGLTWVGCELEPKFVDLAQKNINLWNSKYSRMPQWGYAFIVQGDSRHLGEFIDKANITVSSPPYSDGSQHTGGDDTHPEFIKGGVYHGVGINGAVFSPPYSEARIGQESGQEHCGRGDQYGDNAGQLGSMKANGFDAAISSPPFLQSEGGSPEPKPGGPIDKALYARHAAGNKSTDAYGDEDAQLSNMPAKGFDAAISSAPYSGMEVEKNSKSIDRTKQYKSYKRSGGGSSFEAFCHTQDIHSQGYGDSAGQLSSMKSGPESFDVAVSSPPFERNGVRDHEGQHAKLEATLKGGHGFMMNDTYGESDGNIGNDSGDDFWLAARAIVDQVYSILAPGGHAVWVCKDFVKAKKIVPFSDQWKQLCEAAGFVTIHEHHAMLVHGKQIKLDGTIHHNESKSFFRRLAESKGSPRIDFEVIFCMIKE